MQDEDGGLIRLERSRQWLDHFAGRYLDPALRLHGFRRRGPSWNRELDELVQVLHIQAGRFGPGLSASMGVFVPVIHQFIRAEPPPKFITEHLCQLQSALGHWGSGLRFERTDPEDIGKRVHFDQPTINPHEIQESLRDGVAALGEVRSLDDVRHVLLDQTEQHRWHSGGPSGSRDECLAILAARSGDTAAARELLLSALNHTPPAALSSRLGHFQSIAQRLGVVL